MKFSRFLFSPTLFFFSLLTQLFHSQTQLLYSQDIPFSIPQGKRDLFRCQTRIEPAPGCYSLIFDDGKDQDPTSLNGVTQRTIFTIITSQQEGALYGLPLVIEEKTLDLQSLQEHVLSTIVYHYFSTGELDCLEIYDFEGNYKRVDSESPALYKEKISFHQSHSLGDFLGMDHGMEEIEKIGEIIFGKSLYLLAGHHNDRGEKGVYGQGEVHPKVRITCINGILTFKEQMMYALNILSSAHGNANIHYIYRTTTGWTQDLLKCGIIKFGYISKEARELAECWKEMIHQMGGPFGGGKIIHYAHSIGGSETYAAKSLMTPDELKIIEVITLGSASLIPEGGFNQVSNYVSMRDGVSLIADPVRYLWAVISPDSNVHFVGSHYGKPLVDHFFAGENYRNVVESFGLNFVSKYGVVR